MLDFSEYNLHSKKCGKQHATVRQPIKKATIIDNINASNTENGVELYFFISFQQVHNINLIIVMVV